VPKSTLGDWDKQLHDEIARLRAIEWEAIEEQFGRTIEQDLRAMAERIRKWEARIDRMNPDHFNIRHVLAVLRETRREYFRRRAILMAPLERSAPSKNPDDSGRSSISSPTQPLHTSHLRQSGSPSSDFPKLQTETDHEAATASNVHDTPMDVRLLSPLPRGEGQGEGQTGSQDALLAAVKSAIHEPQSTIESSSPPSFLPLDVPSKGDDAFLGSVVISPYECGTAVVLKTIEQETAHRARLAAADP